MAYARKRKAATRRKAPQTRRRTASGTRRRTSSRRRAPAKRAGAARRSVKQQVVRLEIIQRPTDAAPAAMPDTRKEVAPKRARL